MMSSVDCRIRTRRMLHLPYRERSKTVRQLSISVVKQVIWRCGKRIYLSLLHLVLVDATLLQVVDLELPLCLLTPHHQRTS